MCRGFLLQCRQPPGSLSSDARDAHLRRIEKADAAARIPFLVDLRQGLDCVENLEAITPAVHKAGVVIVI